MPKLIDFDILMLVENGSKLVHTTQFSPQIDNSKHQMAQLLSCSKAIADRALEFFIAVKFNL